MPEQISLLPLAELAAGKNWLVLAKRGLMIAIAAVFLLAHKENLIVTVVGLLALFAYLSFDAFRTWWLVTAELALAFFLTAESDLAPLLSLLTRSATGQSIDCLGFDYCEIVAMLGATDIAMTALKVQESDDDSSS